MPRDTFRHFRYGRLEPMAKPELASDDDDETTAATRNDTEPIWTRKQATLALLGNLVMLLMSISLLCVAISRRPSPSELECAKKVSSYSPIWGAVRFLDSNIINDFNASSIYRGKPTLERERAWHNLWHYHLIPVDAAGVEALNQTQNGRHAEVSDSDPTNPQYGATIEVFHQLHCLNTLRQNSWPLEMFDKSWGEVYPTLMEDGGMTRMHVDHCIETLRLALMCNADITPILFTNNETKGPPGLRADFNIHRKCRDFNNIVDYIKENGVEIYT